jgi:DNA polymerase III epsilon subunit-like protein
MRSNAADKGYHIMENVIIIDTETVTGTYGLLSAGLVVVALDGGRITPLDTYFGFSDEFHYGFYYAQQAAYAKRNGVKRKPRCEIEEEINGLVRRYDVKTALAYNARFDKTVSRQYFPSLEFRWLDLVKPARQVLAGAEHYPAYQRLYPGVELTRGGLLKRNYSVECVGRYLGLPHETHVAVEDAQMEMEIAIRLGLLNSAHPVK